MNQKKLTDEQLVEIVRTKDQEMYEELVIRYQQKLIRYATYLTGDQELAADAAQNAFIKGFKNLKGFNTDKKFSSWIYRITHNEAMNLIKKDKRLVKVDDSVWNNLEKDGEDIEEEYDKKQIQLAVKQSLDKLPIEYKSPLALYYMDGKSYVEIGEILRMPVGTVGTRINRGKKMMLKKFEGEGNG